MCFLSLPISVKMFHPGMGFGLFGLGMVASPHVHAVHSKGVCQQGRHPLCLRLQTVAADVSTCGDAGSNVGVGSSLPVRRMRTPGQLASWIKNSPAVCMKVKTKQGQLSCIRCIPFQFYRPPCAGPMGYPLTRWCGGIAWYGWIPSDPDRIIVPWTVEGVGIGDTKHGVTMYTRCSSVQLDFRSSEPAL